MLNKPYIVSVKLLKHCIEDITKYPFNLPVVKYLNSINLHKNVSFFIGENGTGKSTLLEAIAVKYGLNPEGGSKHFNFKTQNTHSTLADKICITKGINTPKDSYFLRAESFYNLASNIDLLQKESGKMYSSYGGRSLHQQSHGESFFSLFIHRLFGNGIYIFDEPEAALSPQGQLAFLVRMNELVQQKSQFIIATHSPIILSYPNAKIIQITSKGFETVSYQETEHYRLCKTFFNDYKYMLKNLKII